MDVSKVDLTLGNSRKNEKQMRWYPKISAERFPTVLRHSLGHPKQSSKVSEEI